MNDYRPSMGFWICGDSISNYPGNLYPAGELKFFFSFFFYGSPL